MAKSFTLSEKDYERTQDVLRWTERNKNLRDRFRRRNISRGTNQIKARIVQTLRRADETASPPVTAVNWYEIELLNAAIEEWSDADGVTFQKGDIYKNQNKLYECKITHTNPPALPPDTTPSHWKDATSTKAWVFGYSGDLLEADHWLQPDDIVEVIRYNDERWPDREWWILETMFRIQAGTGEDVRCSLYWLQEVNGKTEARLASVCR